MSKKNGFLRNREISWLDFNERVLQEAFDRRNPLLERVRFLGIFSNNLDEFYRVRVATINKMVRLKMKPSVEFSGWSPKKLLKEISLTTSRLERLFTKAYAELRTEMEHEGIFIIDETQLSDEQMNFVRCFFRDKVRMHLFPVMVRDTRTLGDLRDKSIYLAVGLRRHLHKERDIALIEIPTEIIGRFVTLPSNGKKVMLILLDDVVRLCLDDIFAVFGYNLFEAYTVKFTRDAEIDLDSDISKSFLEIISDGLKQRISGNPVRFIYDREMPKEMLRKIVRCMGIRKRDLIIPSERYHNFKDFISFPPVGHERLRYQPLVPIPVPVFEPRKSAFASIDAGDILIHYPYQPFQHLIDLLREASLDPQVVSIKMTLYRLARNSSVVNALINAARNGKKVTVFIELQARFDEEANIEWARRLQEAGVRILPSLPNLKVHAKLCLIKRREEGSVRYYAVVSTGNFNEETARVYCDETLLTADDRITHEVDRVFDLFTNPYKDKNFKHLLVSPNFLRTRLYRMIDAEIKAARRGEKAAITFKVNSLTDPDMAEKIIAAARTGVSIRLIVRGACLIVPNEEKGLPITATSIVDRFLEHGRIFLFHAGGKERMYLSSADLMTRNLDRRIEVAVPVYDERLKTELKTLLDIQISDNTKARLLSHDHINEYRQSAGPPIRSQQTFFEYLRKRYEKKEVS